MYVCVWEGGVCGVDGGWTPLPSGANMKKDKKLLLKPKINKNLSTEKIQASFSVYCKTKQEQKL